MSELTPEQIESWRKILARMYGPYALFMSVKEIQDFRDKLQADVDKIVPDEVEP